MKPEDVRSSEGNSSKNRKSVSALSTPADDVNGKQFIFYQLKSSAKSCMEFLGFMQTCYLVYAKFPYGQIQRQDPERDLKDDEEESVSGLMREFCILALEDNLQAAHIQIGRFITGCCERMSNLEVDEAVRKKLNVPLDEGEWKPIMPLPGNFTSHFMIIELKGDVETCKTKIKKKDNNAEYIERVKQKCDPSIMRFQLHNNGHYSIQEDMLFNLERCVIS